MVPLLRCKSPFMAPNRTPDVQRSIRRNVEVSPAKCVLDHPNDGHISHARGIGVQDRRAVHQPGRHVAAIVVDSRSASSHIKNSLVEALHDDLFGLGEQTEMAVVLRKKCIDCRLRPFLRW
jgi:hypothetical protein